MNQFSRFRAPFFPPHINAVLKGGFYRALLVLFTLRFLAFVHWVVVDE